MAGWGQSGRFGCQELFVVWRLLNGCAVFCLLVHFWSHSQQRLMQQAGPSALERT